MPTAATNPVRPTGDSVKIQVGLSHIIVICYQLVGSRRDDDTIDNSFITHKPASFVLGIERNSYALSVIIIRYFITCNEDDKEKNYYHRQLMFLCHLYFTAVSLRLRWLDDERNCTFKCSWYYYINCHWYKVFLIINNYRWQ